MTKMRKNRGVAMKILLDTNIFLDIYLKRGEFFEKSYVVFTEAQKKTSTCLVSAKSVLDINYFLKKSLSTLVLRRIISEILTICTVVDVTARDIYEAHGIGGKDFEDDVLSASAQKADADCIITRNKKDFKQTGMKVMTPEEFLKSIEKDKWRVHESAASSYSVEEGRV